MHLASLKAFLTLGFEFVAAQIFATLVAMTSNFFLNNALTYREQRLSGSAALKGLLLFYLFCAVGAISNIGVANWLYTNEPVWWLAGLLGSFVGAVWNYTVSRTIVWRRTLGELAQRSTLSLNVVEFWSRFRQFGFQVVDATSVSTRVARELHRINVSSILIRVRCATIYKPTSKAELR